MACLLGFNRQFEHFQHVWKVWNACTPTLGTNACRQLEQENHQQVLRPGAGNASRGSSTRPSGSGACGNFSGIWALAQEVTWNHCSVCCALVASSVRPLGNMSFSSLALTNSAFLSLANSEYFTWRYADGCLPRCLGCLLQLLKAFRVWCAWQIHCRSCRYFVRFQRHWRMTSLALFQKNGASPGSLFGFTDGSVVVAS